MRPRLLAALLPALLAAACTAPPAPTGDVQPRTPPPLTGVPTPAASPTPEPGQREEQPLPEPMQETGAASAGGRLYIVGGLTPHGASSTSVYYFDGDWHPGPALPFGLDHPGVAGWAGSIYVAGGFSDGRASPRLLRLDGDRWTELAPMRHPRGALALVAAGGRLYALGGAQAPAGPEVAPAEVYQPGSATWEDLPPLTKARDQVAGFAWQTLACIAGGRTPTTGVVDCWDTVQGRWEGFAPLPFATSGAGAGTLGDRVFVAGGEDAQESALVGEVAVFSAGTWSEEPMLVPRHGVQLAEFRGRLWACGGAIEPGLRPVATCTSLA